MYWEQKFPRVVAEAELKEAATADDFIFKGFTDISADYEGSIEMTRYFNKIEDPFMLYSPSTKKYKFKIEEHEEGDILYHCVDHLPAEMPMEASNHFGMKLFPFIEDIVKSDFSKPFGEQEDYATEMKNAVITCHGQLTPNYEYISEMRKVNEQLKKQQKELDLKKIAEKGFSYLYFEISGHLFDKQFFNKSLDLFEKYKANYKITKWEIGQTLHEATTVGLQIAADDEVEMPDMLDEWYSMGEENEVEIVEQTSQSQPDVVREPKDGYDSS